MPAKRARKVRIPGRNGQYDCWEERTVRIDCTLERKVSRSELREIAYYLSRKSILSLWDEPDKHYIGEIYDPSELTDYYDEAMREFTLTFICEPFAFGQTVTVPIASGKNRMEYRGTAETPCLIVLRNVSKTQCANITLTAIKRSV